MTLTPLLKELKEKAEGYDAHVVFYHPENQHYVQFIGSKDILLLIQAIEEMKDVLEGYYSGSYVDHRLEFHPYDIAAHKVIQKYFGEK